MTQDAAETLSWTVLGVVAAALVATLILLVGLTTHESHIKDLKYNNEQMVTCIKSDRSAADCRVIVYGSY